MLAVYDALSIGRDAIGVTLRLDEHPRPSSLYKPGMRPFSALCSSPLNGVAACAGFVHLYCGQEAVSTGIIRHLGQDDYICSTYRDHVHALSKVCALA